MTPEAGEVWLCDFIPEDDVRETPDWFYPSVLLRGPDNWLSFALPGVQYVAAFDSSEVIPLRRIGDVLGAPDEWVLEAWSNG
jgi:hypothetical protein